MHSVLPSETGLERLNSYWCLQFFRIQVQSRLSEELNSYKWFSSLGWLEDRQVIPGFQLLPSRCEISPIKDYVVLGKDGGFIVVR